MGRRAAQDAIAETGVDMTRFRTPAHLASWAGRCPLDQQPAGKNTRRAKVKKRNRYLAGLLGEPGVHLGLATRSGRAARPAAPPIGSSGRYGCLSSWAGTAHTG
jgi:transposase